MRKISPFLHCHSESIFCTLELSEKSASSSTPIHKVQLPNLLASVILFLFSDVTIIESEIKIEFFLKNQIESKSIFWLVFVIDFDSWLYWQRQRTAASSKNDSQRRGVLNTPT